MLGRTGIALLFACCAAMAARAEETTVDWRDAALCVGRVCSLKGTVASEERDGPTYRLYFDVEQREVRVILMRGWLVTWPSFAGHTIISTGRVDRFRDHIEQIVVVPDDVQILDAAPTPTAGGEPTPTPGELERLREQVHELEQRVRELEGR
jgi:hypothetical protein